MVKQNGLRPEKSEALDQSEIFRDHHSHGTLPARTSLAMVPAKFASRAAQFARGPLAIQAPPRLLAQTPMSPKIHPSFWRDDDVWALAPEHKLAFLWLVTNGRTNNAGFLVVSIREFTQDTRLSEEALEGACKGLTRGILRDGRAFWIRHFMRHQWTPGERGLTSRLYNSLCNAVAEMPTTFVAEAVKEYPELYFGVKALVSPLKALPSPEGPCKGLEGPRAEQSRAEQSTEGECEGKQSAASPADSPIGPAVSEKRNGTPALEQALEFCRRHIPAGYAEEEIIAAWHSLEATRDEHIGKLVVGDFFCREFRALSRSAVRERRGVGRRRAARYW
jgi:hypothetical protein